jgi:hypothetical protein
MPWGKSEEEKEAERVAAAQEERRKAEAAAAQAQAEAAAAHAASPVGRAETAYASGDQFFQLEIDISRLSGAAFSSASAVMKTDHRADVLGQIEAAGWSLEHVGYVFIETGEKSTQMFVSTGTSVSGMVQGIYLFRRRDNP